MRIKQYHETMYILIEKARSICIIFDSIRRSVIYCVT